MKTNNHHNWILQRNFASTLFGLLCLGGAVLHAAPLGTEFTYHGRLLQGGNPATGNYDFQFTLYDSDIGGNVVSEPFVAAPTAVSNGVFTVTLNFGSLAFLGDARWLEIGVRTNGSGSAYTTLGPRQPLTATPYALYSVNAANLMSPANAPLDIKVNGQRGLRLEYANDGNYAGMNVLGGYSGNSVSPGVVGGTIAGGGRSGLENRIGDDFATIGGGVNNAANGILSSVAGGANNSASGAGATVAGGRYNSASDIDTTVGGGVGNVASGTASSVGGGDHNTASGLATSISGGVGNAIRDTATWSTIGGGVSNVIAAQGAAIAGGSNNVIEAGADGSFIAAGRSNRIAVDALNSLVGGVANTNEAPDAFIAGARNAMGPAASFSVIGGGLDNRVDGYSSFVGAGRFNAVRTNSEYNVVGGGLQNAVGPDSTNSVIAGGLSNVVQATTAAIAGGKNNMIEPGATGSFIAGGGRNIISSNAHHSFVGGIDNTNAGANSFIAGGFDNTIAATATVGSIGGGQRNVIQAGAQNSVIGGGAANIAGSAASFATVPGGFDNLAGGQFSFAAGNHAKAQHQGSFVWSDSIDAAFASTGSNQFLIRASGGVAIGTNDPAGAALRVAGTVRADGFNGPVAANQLTGLLSPTNLSASAPLAGQVLGYNGSSMVWQNGGSGSPFLLNGTNAYYNGGKVGIGTSTPLAPLDVLGNWTGEQGALNLFGNRPSIRFTGDAGSANQSWLMHLGGGAGNLEFYHRTGPAAWANSLTLHTNGNVGIGTSTPTFPFHVNSTATASQVLASILEPNLANGAFDQIYLGRNGAANECSTFTYTYNSANPAQSVLSLGLYNSSFTINVRGDGNVGIGTLSPQARLHVSGTIQADGFNGPVAASQLTGTLAPANLSATAPSAGQVLGYNGSTMVWQAPAAAGNAWSLSGNSGTSAANFLGTTDNQSLEMKVNNARALRLEPNVTSPNVIGGWNGNVADAGVLGAAIGGGGAATQFGLAASNRVTDHFGTVAGGAHNMAGNANGNLTDGYYATVGGGHYNLATGIASTIAGGSENRATNSNSFVGGGYQNNANGYISTIGGGQGNGASADRATIGGGYANVIQNGAYFSSVGGGSSNKIGVDAYISTIAGGGNNLITSNAYAASVAGGRDNLIQAAAGGAAIGGGIGNTIGVGLYLTTIAGGNLNTATNEAILSTIGGGYQNVVLGQYTTIAGGTYNANAMNYGTIGGGIGNVVNVIDALQSSSVIAGGSGNSISNSGNAVIGGGKANLIQSGSGSATIAGGQTNVIKGAGTTIGGGVRNSIDGGGAATIAGGWGNTNLGGGTIGGGYLNKILTADSADSVISGGRENYIDSGAALATICGGYQNYADGSYSTAAGGYQNYAAGDSSFAAGQNANAIHPGSFVWSSYPSYSASFDDHRFHVHGYNGLSVDYHDQGPDGGGTRWVYVGTHVAGQTIATWTGAYLSDGGAWVPNSDRTRKENFAPVDEQAILAKVLTLPIQTWNYTNEPPAVRHLGPMAQDFHAAFRLNGDDDKHIADVDEGGVALAAIQGLNQKLVEALKAKEARIEALEGRLEKLEQKLSKLTGNGCGQ